MKMPRFVSALALLCVIPAASGAGMSTHTMVGYRAAKHFGKITHSPNSSVYNDAIQAQIESVHAGADFPDFLYACGKYPSHHDAGEAAHWPPWQAAAIRYLRERTDFNRSADMSKQTQKLVAFIYGVSIHYMADELWEGLNEQLGRGQGFVRALSSFNLQHDGMSDNDESVANMGADFHVPLGIGMGGIHPWKREYPIDAILEIYHGAGFPNVTRQSLTNCRLLFDLGLWAEKTFGKMLFPLFAEEGLLKNFPAAPMVAERCLDLPIGGIDDMAVWASWVWERIARWMDDGPPSNPAPRRLRESNRASIATQTREEWAKRLVTALEPLEDHALALMSLSSGDTELTFANPNDLSQGIVYHGSLHTADSRMHAIVAALEAIAVAAAGESAREYIRADKIQFSPLKYSGSPVATTTTRDVVQQGTTPLAYCGDAMAEGDFDGNGVRELAYGCYGEGEPGRPQVGAVRILMNDSSVYVLRGEKTHSRFGRALTVLDFNADGIDDLAVGAPGASWSDEELPNVGDGTPHIRVWGEVAIFFGRKGLGLSSTPGARITSRDDLTALGLVMHSGDVNGDGQEDLLLGVPFSSYRSPNSTLRDDDSILRGGAFAFFSLSTNGDRGAPFDLRRDADIALDELVEQAGYSWFGQSLATVSLGAANKTKLLLVGAPGARNRNGTTVGRVHAFVVGTDTARVPRQLFTVTGDEPLAEFGYSLATDRRGEFLAIGSPASGAKGGALRSGEVRITNVSEILTVISASPSLDAVSLPVRALLKPSGLRRARFGRVLRFCDLGVNATEDLVVGAPLANSALHPEAGAVYLWRGGDALPTGEVTDVDHSAVWKKHGSQSRARFGSALASVSAGHLFVGAPRADSGKGEPAICEMCGNIQSAAVQS